MERNRCVETRHLSDGRHLVLGIILDKCKVKSLSGICPMDAPIQQLGQNGGLEILYRASRPNGRAAG